MTDVLTGTGPTADTGLVRVTVVAGPRRADLALPGVLPVADLLPEVAAVTGALDPAVVHGGYRLVRADGTVLEPAAGLLAQGVEDGAVLTVELGVHDVPPVLYDDVVEAVADAVEAQTVPWSPQDGRTAGLLAAAGLLGVAAVTLALQRPAGLPVAVAAGVVAVLLVTGAAAAARLRAAHETALLLAAAAPVFAAVAGWAALPDDAWLALPAVPAGLAAAVTAGLGALALGHRGAVLLPVVGLGSLLAVVGGVVAAGQPVEAVVTVTAVVVVLAGALVPWVSLAGTRLSAPQPRRDADLVADPEPISPDAVRREARTGRATLLGLTALVSAVLVLAAPFAVRLGLAGALVVLACAVALLLRTRQYRDAVLVRTGVGGAVLALVAAAVTAAGVHPGWRTPLVVLLLAAGVLLVLAAVLPRTPSVRLGRLGDVLEGVALVAVVPLAVVAVGLV